MFLMISHALSGDFDSMIQPSSSAWPPFQPVMSGLETPAT